MSNDVPFGDYLSRGVFDADIDEQYHQYLEDQAEEEIATCFPDEDEGIAWDD